MSIKYEPMSNSVGDGGGRGGLQLIDIGNTGSNKELDFQSGGQADGGAIMRGVSKFVLAVPEGQPASAGNLLHQIALSAAAEKQMLSQRQQQMEQARLQQMEQARLQQMEQARLQEMEQSRLQEMEQSRLQEMEQSRQQTTNHRMSLRTKPPAKQQTYNEAANPPPSKPKPRRRSRKQKLAHDEAPASNPENSLAASLPELQEVVFIPMQPKEPVTREKRKRKSPMRSTMTDTFGEPEFIETYYFEESDNEEEDSYAGNVIHLMKERQRRREMTGHFSALAKEVAPKSEKPCRNDVLTMGAQVVKGFTKRAADLRATKRNLRDINISLRKRLAELLGVSTTINYESEEENEVERVGGYNGYKSSSSDPDNNDADDDEDDDVLDWGRSVDSDEERNEEDFADVKQEEESDTESQDCKVELPDEEDNDDFDGGDGDDEEDDEDQVQHSNRGVRIKQEPASDDEMEQEQHEEESETHADILVRVKLEPGEDDESEESVGVETFTADETATAAVETSTEPIAAIRPSPLSSRNRTNQRSEDDDELFDRYERVKIEPRSPVRRALFMDSGSQDSTDEQVVDENVLVAATLDMDSLQAVKTESGDDDDGDDGDDFAQNLASEDPSDSIRINVDPRLLNVKQEPEEDF